MDGEGALRTDASTGNGGLIPIHVSFREAGSPAGDGNDGDIERSGQRLGQRAHLVEEAGVARDPHGGSGAADQVPVRRVGSVRHRPVPVVGPGQPHVDATADAADPSGIGIAVSMPRCWSQRALTGAVSTGTPGSFRSERSSR